MRKILIIGGNAAGLSAASRAKRIDPNLDITVLESCPRFPIAPAAAYMRRKLVTPET
jgi:NADPH-dependent 2,4-dienoyl-CoA reductase/sulfur reductase-like enzyme